jgi:hypothetical protein
MTILFWVIAIHLFELFLVAAYLLVSKNSKLEKTVLDQQSYIDAISIAISDADSTIQELDNRGAFESDDEVGTFFKSLKEIQNILNRFNVNKN